MRDYVLRICCAVFVMLAVAGQAWAAENEAPRRFASKGYALLFHRDGRVDVCVARNGHDVVVGTVSGIDFEAMQMQSQGPVSITSGSVQVDSARRVDFANIATTAERLRLIWPTVSVVYPCAKGRFVATWTLMPEFARLQIAVEPAEGEKAIEGRVKVRFKTVEGATMAEAINPTLWQRHADGGAPFQRTAGMAWRYRVGGETFFVANDQGFGELCDATGIWGMVRNVQRPWLSDQLQANVMFGFGQSPASMPLAVSMARRAGIAMAVRSAEPFYVVESVDRPIQLTADVMNLFTTTQRVDVEWIARDFDGKVIASQTVNQRMAPLQRWACPISIQAVQAGPIYVDITARHDFASTYRHLCVGVLPKREFAAGHDSRFGISAYRSASWQHSEGRTERQVLELMGRIGVRWLRMAEDHHLAQEMGFFTWYHNGIYDAEAQKYFAGQPTWIDDPKNRENWLTGNLQKVLEQKNEYFEFSNEWNLHGGENNGVLAEKYAKDWLTILKPLRDKMAPNVKLTGLTVGNTDRVFIDKVAKAGGWDNFDVVAFHAACTPRSVDFDDGQTYWSYLGTLREMRAVLKQYGEKEVWLTEMYSPDAPNSSINPNERTSAENLLLSVALAFAADIRGFMYYCFDDYVPSWLSGEVKTSAQVGEPAEREQYFGMVRFDWTPKTQLWAYQNAAHVFDGATFRGDVKMPAKDVCGLLFDSPAGPFAVLWSRKEGFQLHEPPVNPNAHRPPWCDTWSVRSTLVVDAESSGVTVIDCIGRATSLQPDASGQCRIELTGAPIVVRGGKFAATKGRFSQAFLR
jgi:hypothetical protein